MSVKTQCVVVGVSFCFVIYVVDSFWEWLCDFYRDTFVDFVVVDVVERFVLLVDFNVFVLYVIFESGFGLFRVDWFYGFTFVVIQSFFYEFDCFWFVDFPAVVC